eukprot:6482652-Amphidinium_carterae.2
MAHEGGVSDSTVRARLTSKAKAAGMQDAANILQLLWPGHAAALRSTWGNPAVVKSIITSLAKKEGIALSQSDSTKDGEDPVYEKDPWARAKTQEKPAQRQNTDKFDALTLHSALRMQDGTTLVRLETDDLGAHAAGFVFIHASLLAEWLPTIRVTGSPTVVITHKSSASPPTEPSMLAQVVVSSAGGPKRVMQVSLILFSIDAVEVVQQAMVLNIPQAKRHEVVMEMFEEQSSPTVFANWLRRGDLAAVLGSCAPLFSPAATGNHRVAGEPPGRVIRRSGSVPVDETLKFLSLSGVEHVNIKLCRQAQEAELGLSSVWAQTTERDELLNQLKGLTHAGFLRTKAGKFIVRCTQEHLPQIRMAIAKEDSRYLQSPDLVVTRKWRVSNVPLLFPPNGSRKLSFFVISGIKFHLVRPYLKEEL